MHRRDDESPLSVERVLPQLPTGIHPRPFVRDLNGVGLAGLECFLHSNFVDGQRRGRFLLCGLRFFLALLYLGLTFVSSQLDSENGEDLFRVLAQFLGC